MILHLHDFHNSYNCIISFLEVGMNLINLDQFNYIKNTKKERQFYSFTMLTNVFPLENKQASFLHQKQS